MTKQVPSLPKLPTMIAAAIAALLLVGCNRAPSPASDQVTAAQNAPVGTSQTAATSEEPVQKQGASAAATAVALPDPCKLLSAADIQSITGGTVKHDESNSTSTDCEWNVTMDDVDGVNVHVRSWTGYPGQDPSAWVTGIGETAIWIDAIHELNVQKNGVDIGIQLLGRGAGTGKEHAIALAKIAISRFR